MAGLRRLSNRVFTIFLVAFTLPSTVLTQTCWFPDGETNVMADVPCNQTAINTGGHSPCCGDNDLCLDNGLCFGAGVVSRGSCTDREWGSDCPQYCVGVNQGGGCPISLCSIADGPPHTFTCGFNSTDCYDTRNTFKMHNGGNGFILRQNQFPANDDGTQAPKLVTANTVIEAASGARDSDDIHTQASTTSSASVSDSEPARSPSGYSTGSVAGAAAGTGIPLLLVIAMLSWLLLRQRKQLQAISQPNTTLPGHEKWQPVSTASPDDGQQFAHPGSQYKQSMAGKFQDAQNLYASELREMSTDRELVELDDRNSGR